MLMQMRQVMTANGDDGKKIWATEYGQPSSTGGEAKQNDYIADILLKWQELPYTGPMFINTTRDRSSGTNSTAATLGHLPHRLDAEDRSTDSASRCVGRHPEIR